LETAQRVGHYKWLEMRIFELMGGWVATVPELDIKLRLGTHCYHHSFHAELWHERLPELHDVASEELTRPAGPEIEELMAALGRPTDGGATIEKLVGMYRVFLPHLIAAYTYHLNNVSELADAPTIRALNFCLLDDMEEWREGEMMLQTLILTADEVGRASARQAELGSLMVAAGGVVGSGSIRT
jgi:hypothetical protein